MLAARASYKPENNTNNSDVCFGINGKTNFSSTDSWIFANKVDVCGSTQIDK